MRDLTILSEEYRTFIEDLKASITEGVYASRQTLLDCYHEIGQMIVSQRYASVQQISKDSNIPERTLQRCAQFYEKYPDMAKLPMGKNISWHKVVNQLLPEHKDRPIDEYTICPTCAGRGKIRI
jgi:hypothetical protein